MAGKTTGRMKFYPVLMDDFDPISADRLEKVPEAHPLKLWVKDRALRLPPVTWHIRAKQVAMYHPSGRTGARHCPYGGRALCQDLSSCNI